MFTFTQKQVQDSLTLLSNVAAERPMTFQEHMACKTAVEILSRFIEQAFTPAVPISGADSIQPESPGVTPEQ